MVFSLDKPRLVELHRRCQVTWIGCHCSARERSVLLLASERRESPNQMRTCYKRPHKRATTTAYRRYKRKHHITNRTVNRCLRYLRYLQRHPWQAFYFRRSARSQATHGQISQAEIAPFRYSYCYLHTKEESSSNIPKLKATKNKSLNKSQPSSSKITQSTKPKSK